MAIPIQGTQWAVALAAAALLCMLGMHTYGFSLSLPLFSDDVLFVRWIDAHKLSEIWTSAPGYSYYRPLALTIWKVLALIQHGHDAFALHATVFALHLLNSVLVFALLAGPDPTRRPHLAPGFSAAVLFLLFPFSYQVVPWVSALMYPLVTTLILSSLLLARWASGNPWYRGLSIILALLAPFTHETGVLVAALLFLLLITDDPPAPFRQALRYTLPHWLCSVLGVAVWLAVPKGLGQVNPLDWSARWQNAVYLAQGLIFPLAPLVQRALSLNLGNLSTIALIAGITVTSWAALMSRVGQGKLVGLAIGWFTITLLPAWALLRPDYVRTSPHLLYQASVGIALFWAIPANLRPSGHLFSIAAQGLAALCVSWAAVSGYRFIRSRIPLYDQVRLAVSQLAGACAGISDPILLVNYPQWFAPQHNTFPLGSEGVVLVPPVATGLSDLLWANAAQERSIKGIVFMEPLDKTPWRFIFPGVGQVVDSDSLQDALRQAPHIIVTSYAQPDVVLRDVGGLEAEGQMPPTNYIANYADKLLLISASQKPEGDSLRITLRWYCTAPVTQETSVFVHLYDSENRLAAQADGYPLLNMARMVSWRPGDMWRDIRFLALPEDETSGRYILKIGLYPIAGGPRLSAFSPTGERFVDDAVPITTLELPLDPRERNEH